MWNLGWAWAEEPPMLEQIVVTASRVKEKKKDVTANVTVIDEEEIKSSSAKDLGELLAEKGIGDVRQYPGILTSVGIRGFRTDTHGNDLQSHVLILIVAEGQGRAIWLRFSLKMLREWRLSGVQVQYNMAPRVWVE